VIRIDDHTSQPWVASLRGLRIERIDLTTMPDPGGDVRVRVVMRCADARDPTHRTIDVVSEQTRFRDLFDRESIADAVKAVVMAVLEHEVEEWLTLSGERCYDPHFGDR